MAHHPANVQGRGAEHRAGSSKPVTRCLVLQTDHPLLVRAAVEKLRKSGSYTGCKWALACRQEDVESFADLPDVELIAFPRQGGFRIVDLWRRISKFGPDLVCAVLNRRPVFRKQKLLFFLLPVRRRLIMDGRMRPFPVRIRNIPAILRRSRYEGKLPDKESTILFLPTEADSPSLDALGRLQDRKIAGPGRVLVFCSKAKKTLYESRPEVSKVFTYESGQILANLRTISRLARMRVGVLTAIFSGRPVFRLHKLMFLLLPAGSRLVFNEHRDCWYLRRTPRGLRKIWRTPSLRFSRWESTILFLPTESDDFSLDVLGRLQDRKIVGPGRRVRVFCSKPKKTLYESRPDVSEVITYEPGRTLANLRTISRLARMRVGVVAAIFSGRPIFRLHKLTFLLLPARSRLVFNEHRDCWYLRRTPRGLRKIWRTPSLRFSRWESTILFLPTESDAVSIAVLGRLQDRKIVGPAQVQVFCPKSKKTLYESRPDVSEVVTYESGQTLANLRTISRLARMRVGVVAAIFSGRPIFRLHKLMFLLIPARDRLVFNEHQDCWFLKRNLRGLLDLWEMQSSTSDDLPRRILRQILKAILFFPRYLYLVLWLLLGSLKKGGSKRLVVFRRNTFGKRNFGGYD